MPLPVRAASIRTTTDNRARISRAPQPTQASKSKVDEVVNTTREKISEDTGSSAVSAKTSADGSQSTTRIPSPFKRDIPRQSQEYHAPNTSQQKKCHTRQRSAAIPSLNPPRNSGHTRSISTVSINTVPTAGSEQTKPSVKLSLDHRLQLAMDVTRMRSTPQIRITTDHGKPNFRASPTLDHDETLQNELLQLSAVYKDSSVQLGKYQHSVRARISERQADLSAIQSSISQKEQAFSMALNLSAIDEWLQEGGTSSTCQQIQDLSIAVQNLTGLQKIFDGEGGLVSTFQAWHHKAVNLAYGAEEDDTGSLISMQPGVESQWLSELPRFKHQVASSLAVLSNLPPSLAGSTLAVIREGYIQLANNLILESEIMLQIGQRLTLQRQRWMKDQLIAAIRELELSNNDHTVGFINNTEPLWAS